MGENHRSCYYEYRQDGRKLQLGHKQIERRSMEHLQETFPVGEAPNEGHVIKKRR